MFRRPVAPPLPSTGPMSRDSGPRFGDRIGLQVASGLIILATLLVGASCLLARTAGVPLQIALPASLIVLAGIAVPVWQGLPALAETGRFGVANAITLGRAGIACLLAGLLAAIGLADLVQQSAPVSAMLSWTLVGLGTVAAMLDGVDGWVARRFGPATGYGARFDMEVDAGSILLLSALVWQTGAADLPGLPALWVLAIGLMRYGFAAAGRLVPALRGPLPQSRLQALRRKAACVVQQVSLIAALAPPLHGAVAAGLLASALAVLIFSFNADCRHLLRGGADGR